MENEKNEKEIKKEKFKRRFIITYIAFFTAVLIHAGYVVIKDYKTKEHDMYYDENDIPKRIVIYETEENYKGYDYIIRNNEAIKEYKANCVYFLINKETNEMEEYIIVDDGDPMELGKHNFHLYDFNTEELLVVRAIPGYRDNIFTNEIYYNHLVDDYNWIPLSNISNYVENVEVKETYTKNEIEEIKTQLLEGYLLIDTAKKKSM